MIRTFGKVAGFATRVFGDIAKESFATRRHDMMCEHVRGALLGLQELQKVHKLYTNGKLLLPRQMTQIVR